MRVVYKGPLKKAPPLMSEASFLKNVISKTKTFFKDIYKDVKKNASKIMRQIRQDFKGNKSPEMFQPGSLINFQYKAKDATKKYDKVPLVICLGPPKNPKLAKTHMYGLNCHYLPLKERVGFATYFLELKNRKGGELTYDDVRPFIDRFQGKASGSILRMYIIKNISNKVYKLDGEMMITASALPSEKWFNP